MSTSVQPLALSDLGPIAQLRTGRLPRRAVQLGIGLTLYGVSLALMIRGALGLSPWDVLHSGLIRWLPLTIGQTIIAASFVVLLLWIPLREKPGIGTLANAVIIGTATDAALALIAAPDQLLSMALLLASGLALNALATAMYIGAQLGRGPRDGLMTGLARRTGWSLRLVRTGIELAVVAVGFGLGGAVGVGTLLYAFGIGPLAQLMLPRWIVRPLPPGVSPD